MMPICVVEEPIKAVGKVKPKMVLLYTTEETREEIRKLATELDCSMDKAVQLSVLYMLDSLDDIRKAIDDPPRSTN